MVSNAILAKRRKRRERTYLDLKDENLRLKQILNRMLRKAEHGCTDASCSLCDPAQKEDGLLELA